ncbi:hypothetical protein DRV84_11405 [Rhodosalinus sediminis]|uniref:Uncharacterized protein n=2 Tax=Rhodosalinus sediminis TaxID=1940533 RepID=A0A3D9BQ19_9RHOB|nr:hypothetical protein DRV84_11405 [Rhodosalinus sediminis]
MLAALALSLIAPAAQAFRAENGLEVTALPEPATFEVIQSRGAGPTQIWCAAADYARAELSGGASDRLVITAPRGPAETDAQRDATRFRLMSREARPETTARGFAIVREAGETYSVSTADAFCAVDQPGRGDTWDP